MPKITRNALIIGGVAVAGIVAIAGTVVALRYRTTKVDDENGNILEPVRRVGGSDRMTIYYMPQSKRLYVDIGGWKSPGVSHTHIEGSYIPTAVLERLFLATLENSNQWSYDTPKDVILNDMRSLYQWHYGIEKPAKWSNKVSSSGSPPDLSTDKLVINGEMQPFILTVKEPIVTYSDMFYKGSKTGSKALTWKPGDVLNYTQATINAFRSSNQAIIHQLADQQVMNAAFDKAFALYIPQIPTTSSGGGAGNTGLATLGTTVTGAVTTVLPTTNTTSSVVSGSSTIGGGGVASAGGLASSGLLYGTVMPFKMPASAPAQINGGMGNRPQVDPAQYRPDQGGILKRALAFIFWNRKWKGPKYYTDIGDNIKLGCQGDFKANGTGYTNTGNSWFVNIDGWESSPYPYPNQANLYDEVARKEAIWNPNGAPYQYPDMVMSNIQKYLNYEISSVRGGQNTCYYLKH